MVKPSLKILQGNCKVDHCHSDYCYIRYLAFAVLVVNEQVVFSLVDYLES